MLSHAISSRSSILTTRPYAEPPCKGRIDTLRTGGTLSVNQGHVPGSCPPLRGGGRKARGVGSFATADETSFES